MARQTLQQGRRWYVLHTYSGYEENVQRNLRQRIESRGALKPAHARLLIKLTIKESALASEGVWPKIRPEEKLFLPELMFNPEICSKHKCPTWENIKQLKNIKKSAILGTHSDYWSVRHELLPSKYKLLLVDFDEAVDMLAKILEIKLTVDYLPAFADALKYILATEIKGSEIGVSEILNDLVIKNDLFWGLLQIHYQTDLENANQYHISTQNQQEPEWRKLMTSASRVQNLMENLSSNLIDAKSSNIKAYGYFIKKQAGKWKKLIEGGQNFHTYIEKGNSGLLNIKLAPSFAMLADKFSKTVPPVTLLTIATGADSVTFHYTNSLGINDWPVTTVDLSRGKGRASLKTVKSHQKELDLVLKILLENQFQKAAVIAKNAREAILIAEHLTSALGENTRILHLAQGGANKIIYNFAREARAVLVMTPRGRALSLPWPMIDLAIIASIPFPAPDQVSDFMNGAFPKAMLAYKTLLTKLLGSGQPDLRIFMIDGRLTRQNYGQNFISLAEELCGCKSEYLNM